MPRTESRRRLGVVLLAALVVLAGCSGAGSGGGGAGEAATQSVEREKAAGGDGAAAPATGSGAGGDALRIRQRQIVKTGEVTVQVGNFDAARRNLTAAARDFGGFVSDSSRRRHETRAGTYVTGTVTLRVPRERFGAMMDRAEAAGTVQSSTVRSTDVTDQLVDIEARLKNLRAQRERLRTLYEQANDTEAVLEVQRRLSETQERIERLEAKRRALKRQVAYSTVRVELREERPEPGPDEIRKWYDVPLVGAFLESVNGVVTVARAAAVLAAYALPYLLAFGLPPVLLTAVAYRRWRGPSGGDGDGGGSGADGTAVAGDGADEADGNGKATDGADEAGENAGPDAELLDEGGSGSAAEGGSDATDDATDR